jgi:hypothetical protein
MPSASTIALFDGAATPVSHDFVPLSVTPKNTILVNRESDTSAGNMQLIVAFDPAKANRKTDRVNVRFNFPVEQTVDSVVSVAYTARMSSDVIVPDQMTDTQRDDFAAFCGNAMKHAIIQGYFDSNRDPMY